MMFYGSERLVDASEQLSRALNEAMSLVLAAERLGSTVTAACCAPRMRMAEAGWLRPLWTCRGHI